MQASAKDAVGALACPRCKAPLQVLQTHCRCTSSECKSEYPIVGNTPILIVEERSVFRLENYSPRESISLGYEPRRPIVSLIHRWMPSITENRIGEQLYLELIRLLRQIPGEALKRVLIVGAGDSGEGIAALRAAPDILVFETDVYFAGTVVVIADGHDLPFLDASFDAVVLQAVLEHVADPVRCVAEAHRVLRDGGLVYAESPFMYPVHLGAYDFQRFSLTGHRRLFRQFHELKVGVIAGATPGALSGLCLEASQDSLRRRPRISSRSESWRHQRASSLD